jgi:glycosyltransferase involved in cell wall biosynthesis
MSSTLSSAAGLDDAPRSSVPRVAVLTNSLTPYRIHLHERIVAEVPEVELGSLATHANAYNRWSDSAVPAAIRPVEFGNGEPTTEQTQLRFSGREWRKAGRIIRWLEQQEVAAVFCQGCGDVGRLRVLRWCHRNRIPCFLTGDCNIRSDRCAGVRRLVKRAVFRRAVAWAYGIMPCGEYGRALYERYGASHKPTIFFPFIPDIELFENPPAEAIESARRLFDLDPQRRRVLFSARLMRVKRPDLALKAFVAIASSRPGWDLVMAGDGPLRSELEASVPAELKQRIVWTGFVHDQRELAGLYAQCDALLLPSDKEPWGVVVVEAAAAGLAIIASDVVGASPELVKTDRNGAVFPAGDLDELVKALEQVSDEANIDRMQNESRRVLSEWLADADPVVGFRKALVACGILENKRQQLRSLPANGRYSDKVFATNC